jgi:hypothetical protein
MAWHYMVRACQVSGVCGLSRRNASHCRMSSSTDSAVLIVKTGYHMASIA